MQDTIQTPHDHCTDESQKSREGSPSREHDRYQDSLDLTGKTLTEGMELFAKYQRAMTLGEAWTPPPSDEGFRMIPGVAGEVVDAFEDRADQLKVASRITGHDEQIIYAVMETMGILDRCFGSWAGSQPDWIAFTPPSQC